MTDKHEIIIEAQGGLTVPTMPAAQSSVALMITQNQSAIATMAADPKCDPAKLHSLMDLQDRWMKQQAEIIFNQQFTKMQMSLPKIQKSGVIVHNGKLIGTYGKFEDIDAAIRPILFQFGFSIRFDSHREGENVIVYATLAHIDGHSIKGEVPLTVKTNAAISYNQAVNGAVTTGKRILCSMLLNLVFEDEDADAVVANYTKIDHWQVADIDTRLRDTGADRARFLKYMEVDKVEDINLKDYPKAMVALRKKGGAA